MLREMQGSGTSGASADQIKNLIAQGRTEEAVKILLSITENTASKDEALLLSGRLNALTRQNRLGMIDFREYQADLNRITYAALKLVDEMAKHTEIRVATSDITDVEIVGGRDRVEHMAGDGNLLKIKWLENSVKTAEAIGWVKNNNTGGVVGNFSVVNFEGNDYLLTDARFADMTLGYVFENNIVEYSGQYLAKNVLKYQTMELSGKSARFLINRNQSGVEIPLTIAHEAIRSQRDAMLITVTAKGPAIHFVEISDNGGDVIRILSEKIDAILPGAPLLDREWRLIGMMQTNTSAVSSRTFFRELAQNNAEAASVERPQMGAMKFVVFYEEKDEHYAQTLKKYLKPISLSKGLKLHLLHSDALGGEDPLRRAMSELDSAQYVICMITADFLAGEWAPFALEKTGKRVIPIRCTQMSLEGTGYDKLRSLPTQGRTVADFPSEDAAFADIAAELRRLLA